MTSRALESEVELLNTEVTRLRLMVQRCVGAQQEQKARSSDHVDPHTVLGGGAASGPYADASPPPPPSAVRIPQPDDPVSVLPTLFSGMDGTARLFKVLLETYPWLLPADLREAQEELELKKSKSGSSHRHIISRHAPEGHSRKKKNKKKSAVKARPPPSASTSTSSDSDSSSSTDSDSAMEDSIPYVKKGRAGRRHTAVGERLSDVPHGGTGRSSVPPPSTRELSQGSAMDGNVSPRPSGGFPSNNSIPGILGLSRRGGSPGMRTSSPASPNTNPTTPIAAFLPGPLKKKTASSVSILDKIKRMGEEDSSEDDVYVPGHKRRALSSNNDDGSSSGKNSFVDETLEPKGGGGDDHDF